MFKLSSRFSWAAEQLECLAEHLPGQWSHRTEVCLTLRHYGWPARAEKNATAHRKGSLCKSPA